MRIAHVVGTLEIGGAETLVLRLAALQLAMGHQPSVHFLFESGSLHQAFRDAGIPLFSHISPTKRRRIRSLMAAFSSQKIEAVHCHNVAPTLLGSLAARASGIRRLITTCHNLGHATSGRDSLLYSLAGRLCRNVVAVCDAARNNLLAAPFADSSRIVTIYNGTHPIDLSTASPPSTSSNFVVLQVGRMASPKDPFTLLQAFQILHAAVPSAALWIVGGGPLLEPAKIRAAELGLHDAAVFWGPQPDVRPFLAGSSLFVLSSKSEGVPIALLEAMACGLPAVLSAVGGIPEVAAPGDGSCLVPPSDPNALAEAMLRYATQPSLRHRAGIIASQHFRSFFTIQRMHDDYLRLLS